MKKTLQNNIGSSRFQNKQKNTKTPLRTFKRNFPKMSYGELSQNAGSFKIQPTSRVYFTPLSPGKKNNNTETNLGSTRVSPHSERQPPWYSPSVGLGHLTSFPVFFLVLLYNVVPKGKFTQIQVKPFDLK